MKVLLRCEGHVLENGNVPEPESYSRTTYLPTSSNARCLSLSALISAAKRNDFRALGREKIDEKMDKSRQE
ncbi:hypothetical protein G9A89_001796 [Geosiphon pyriformis]|nr:hypothetical protein G9A89_001796 [Geosiphon pyriformis]